MYIIDKLIFEIQHVTIDKGKDSVNPLTAWVLTKINGLSRSADWWVVNANHTVRNYQLLHWFAIADD
ncbi:hypothetical protein T05_9130 [Trichinella murrelli]|uniref:Uncharacterized protein n=1 Tax=Trichinella murrelli TaxID=144512 RepID=A0A0V0TU48_9BILA|nr:hypothetical protein T05_9130 [Trichinella murrelli]